jgi:spoIIIJ-associated protein
MDLQSEITVDRADVEEGLPTVELGIHGEYGGILIGRRGETLGALQFLAGLLTSRRAERRVRVILDAEGYRERRARLLRDVAMRAAERAQRYRQPIFLDPMVPAERRVVHMTLADHPGVSTHSVGEGDSRRVVISPRQAQRFGGYGNR